MVSIVDLVRPRAAFDPETIAVLCAALDEAWDRLLRSGNECTRPAYARAMREVVARRIVDMAQRGTRAQLNSEIEHQTARDSTVPGEKPLGARAAVMADTVGAKQD